MAAETTYVWTGEGPDGQPSQGELQCRSAAVAKAMLRRQGIRSFQVRVKRPRPAVWRADRRTSERTSRFSGGGGRPDTGDIALFTRQVATMLRAGAPLVRAFGVVADGSGKRRMQNLVRAVRDQVAGGESFAAALRKHPKHFDALFCSLVDAGEQAGALDAMLEQIAGYQEKAQSLKGKVKKAMTYPLAVVAVALVVTSILLIEVVPRFEAVFNGFGAELPAFTRGVIALSEWARDAWLPMVAVAGTAGAGAWLALRRSRAVRRVFDACVLKAPVAGGIIKMAVVARCARTLSTTFAAGVPLIEALDSVAGAAGNRLFEEAIVTVRDDVSTGRQLHQAMDASGLFPAMMVQMVMIGEEAGAVDELLARAASYYEEQVDNRVDNLTALMEPLIMSVLGVLIGGLVIAMYLPIFQLGTVVGG
ncbi:MAG: type II secretion system F family protein [Gammaproteobacteria bacterium]|nr:type II secretion system F family protein [Gammaproteobacteria bacterium]MYG14203.1 type II secretion system F family protein [Gammaproteobacteria bacterium]MYK27223.1 type II secretion system F family protein [Gammaproteobacteria bacterium]